jgi:hypothetical protein
LWCKAAYGKKKRVTKEDWEMESVIDGDGTIKVEDGQGRL